MAELIRLVQGQAIIEADAPPATLTVDGDAEVSAVIAAAGGDLSQVSCIAIQFPKFTDGRGYSLAVLLRRAGFGGELRAQGDIGQDQLNYLSRSGFDSFILREGTPAASAVAGLRDFSEPYQNTASDPRPLWARISRN